VDLREVDFTNDRRIHAGITSTEIKGVERVSEGERLPKTMQISIGHARGRMAGCSQAPVLILAAPDALAPSIAMTIRTAAA
jgi:hypothetical protein